MFLLIRGALSSTETEQQIPSTPPLQDRESSRTDSSELKTETDSTTFNLLTIETDDEFPTCQIPFTV